MKSPLTVEHLQNAIDSYSKSCPELGKFTIVKSDARLGKKVALGVAGDSGSLYVKTDFLSYSEMNQFLRGYFFKGEKRFEK